MFEFDSELFQEKYKIQSTRLHHWDYSSNGLYFITICTKDRTDYFGKIKNGIICLNKYGSIVCQEIYKTSLIRKNVIIDEFIIMPNHIHLILEINNKHNNIDKHGRDEASPRLYDNNKIGKYNLASPRLYVGKHSNMSRISPKSNSLSSIIGSLKSIITKRIHLIHQNGLIDFKWQSRFYDHIIRDEEDLYRIKEYVKNNSLNWDRDRNNK